MDDDLYDEDFSEEDRLEAAYEQFKEEHGAEYAQEDLNDEVLHYVIAAHEKLWSVVHEEIEKGRRRLDDGERDEGVFHIFRALDHYIKIVLASPVRAVFVDRFNRSLESTEKTEAQLFKAVHGAGRAMDFAVFGVAVLAPNAGERDLLVSAFEAFQAHWGRRNAIFHSVTAPTQNDLKTLTDFLDGPFGSVAHIAESAAIESRRKKREYELSPVPVQILRSLVDHFDRDAAYFVPEEDIISDGAADLNSVLRRLLGEGRVEEQGFLERGWRLTIEGRRHFRVDVEPQL